MNTGKRIIDLSLIPDGIEPRLYVSQYDVGVTLTFNWSGTLAAGGAARVMGTKPSGIGFDLTCTRVGSGTSVTGFTVETTLDMTSEAGEFPAEIRITEGTQVVGSQNFTLVVERSPHPDGTIDGYEEGRTIIETVTGLVNDAEESASEAATSATAAAQSATAAAQSATSAAADAESADASAARAMATTPEGYEEFVTELLANQNGGYVRKNLLPCTVASKSQNGGTFTVNSDGSVRVAGTFTTRTNLTYFSNTAGQFPKGTYIISGCPSGGATNKYMFHAWNQTQVRETADTGNGATLVYNGTDSLTVEISVYAGAYDLTFYPMVRPATIEDGTYVPYAPSNSALNADLAKSSSTYSSEYLATPAVVLRFGALRVLYISTPKNLAGSENTTLFTLDSEDRIASSSSRISVDVQTPTGTALRFHVNPNGTVQVYNYGSTTTGNVNVNILIPYVAGI